MHVPLWQVVPAAQRFPHPPQFALSLCSFTQTDPHAVVPIAQTNLHMPPAHVSAPGHTLPQPPQSFGFDVVSTQAPLHALCPEGHLQVPALHVAPDAQALAQLPQ